MVMPRRNVMRLDAPESYYHVYARGNSKHRIFIDEQDFITFLQILERYLSPEEAKNVNGMSYPNFYNKVDLIAYCLMPNHFHFLIGVTEKSTEKIKLGGIEIDRITDGFRKLLSEYAQEFNLKSHRSGSLFRQKTKGKLLHSDGDYAIICFHYIHQNPYRAKLVKKIEDWEFSSFRDYAQLRNGTLCKKDITSLYFEISSSNFYEESYQVIPDSIVEKLF